MVRRLDATLTSFFGFHRIALLMQPTTFALLFAVACAPEAPLAPLPCADCSLTDDNQYLYDATLNAEVIEVIPGRDAEIDWTAVSRDLQGHAVATADISEAMLVGFVGLSPDEIADQIAADTLRQDSVAVWLTADSTEGHVRLSDFGMMGNQLQIEEYVQPGITWLVAVRAPGATKIASMAFVVATDTAMLASDHAPNLFESAESDGRVAEVVLDNQSSSLAVDVDFESSDVLVVESGHSGLVLDWSAVSADGLGNPLAFPTVTDLFLGHFSQSRSELQSEVFDLTTTADEFWTMRLGGSSWANVSSLDGETPFNGVSSEGTWLLALSCSNCMNPAPRLVAFLQGSGE